jgi:hypothetical protein
MQNKGDDENIPSIDTTDVPTVTQIQRPINRVRVKQLNYHVLTFLEIISQIHENMMLPKSRAELHWLTLMHMHQGKKKILMLL